METSITKEREQYRTTVPKKLLEKSNNKKGDIVEWKIKKGNLGASVISHEEFMKKIEESQKLENRTKDALNVGDEK